jgi:hypothetical protein
MFLFMRLMPLALEIWSYMTLKLDAGIDEKCTYSDGIDGII